MSRETLGLYNIGTAYANIMLKSATPDNGTDSSVIGVGIETKDNDTAADSSIISKSKFMKFSQRNSVHVAATSQQISNHLSLPDPQLNTMRTNKLLESENIKF